MRTPVIFSRICLLWMLFSQAASVICLLEEDWDNPSDALVLTRICPNLWGSALIGILVLLVFGILLMLMYAVKERGLGLNTAWVLSGVIYTILALTGGVLIVQSMPDLYGPPPGLDQFIWVGIVVALDIVSFVAVRRFICLLSK